MSHFGDLVGGLLKKQLPSWEGAELKQEAMNCGSSSEARRSGPYVCFAVMEMSHTNRRISNNTPLNDIVFADLGLDD